MAGSTRKLLGIPSAAFIGIFLIAVILRLINVEIANFWYDQARAAQYVWDIAREGIFHRHMYRLSGGYINFPLAAYIHAPAYFISTHIHAVILWNVMLNLAALILCWFFTRRYWGWQAAAAATLLLATAPWDVFYSNRLWSNTLMPLFMMLWAVASAFAYYERRPRWWALSWVTALWLLQLHPSGIIFPASSAILSGAAFVSERRYAWSWAALGIVLGIFPAMPWIFAHIDGSASLIGEFLPFVGENKQGFYYNWKILVDFLVGQDLAERFHGPGLEQLRAQTSALNVLAPAAMLAVVLATAYVLLMAIRSPNRRLYCVLAPWLLMPLAFPLVVWENTQKMVYFIPLLPASVLAIAAASSALSQRWRKLALGMVAAYSAVNALMIWYSVAFVNNGLAMNDPEIWAVEGGPPLSSPLRIAQAARNAIQRGDAEEVVVLVRPVLELEHEFMTHAMPLLMHDLPVRLIDIRAPTRVFPARNSLLLVDMTQTDLPIAYAGAEELMRSTRYRLLHFQADVGPAPQILLQDHPAFENGLRIRGYDPLQCDGHWRMHWTPGESSTQGLGLVLFAHLLDAQGNLLAQSDEPTIPPHYWRSGDQLMSEVYFNGPVGGLPIHAIHVGFYSWKNSAVFERFWVLDEAGQPRLASIEILLPDGCES